MTVRGGSPLLAAVALLALPIPAATAQEKPAAPATVPPVESATPPASNPPASNPPASNPPAPPESAPAPSRYQSTIVAKDPHPLRSSPEAVEIVDTSVARDQAGDLDALLDQTKGVILRTSGGLGSPTTFDIQGLSGKRVRFFLDGVPADVAGLGIVPTDLPLDLLDQVEIYKGVVPIRFGSDALGGAVNFVTRDPPDRASLDASLEYGSFNTFRASLVGSIPLVKRIHLYVRPEAYVDRSDNDYPIDVQVADAQGQLHPETVRRFHDHYQAYGVGLEAGVRDLPWADRLSLRVFHSDTAKDLQTNIASTVPYGDVTLGDQATATILHFLRADRIDRPFGLEILLGYSNRSGSLDDVSTNIWNWDGQVIGSRAVPGEMGPGMRVQTASQSGFGRINGAWRVARHSRLELNVSPGYADWRQRTQSVTAPDLPWTEARYSQWKVVSGLSWQLRLLGTRLRNELFAKHYYSRPDGPPSGAIVSQPAPAATSTFGGGDGLRLGLWGPLYLKASYEYATRIPDSSELFGDGALIAANAALRPETSHNVNATLAIDGWETRAGRFDGEASFFFRRTRDLIFLSVALDGAQYQNISDVDTIGGEASMSWTGWKVVTLAANGTLLDAVSRTTGGWFGRFNGDRIPNLPYLYGNLAASVNLRWIAAGLERIRVYWYAHYVHEYFLFWESDGDPSHKLRIPEQLVQNVGVTISSPKRRLTGAFEIRNLADEKVFDNVGEQLAGRAFYAKLIVGLD